MHDSQQRLLTCFLRSLSDSADRTGVEAAGRFWHVPTELADASRNRRSAQAIDAAVRDYANRALGVRLLFQPHELAWLRRAFLTGDYEGHPNPDREPAERMAVSLVVRSALMGAHDLALRHGVLYACLRYALPYSFMKTLTALPCEQINDVALRYALSMNIGLRFTRAEQTWLCAALRDSQEIPDLSRNDDGNRLAGLIQSIVSAGGIRL
ncbi:hypothetical protein [Acidihalobacter ferrooxydans]|uniref:Uncharacterized protein n=1 Tax=Acidihalobacter ferrooxydans TaxID=1765967 RepID=A0A1P8UFF8_9GAMM|nr:hypothetical protein [Acidihalobacter ferrooxydans]APZ42577.1 hypothetical protein BW247_05260 [Acidihalobacter ferrooxydans]